jgi:hypothetical protein
MLPVALVRQYAVGQQIDIAVADQEIVLHYVLALLNAEGLIGLGRRRRRAVDAGDRRIRCRRQSIDPIPRIAATKNTLTSTTGSTPGRPKSE